MNQERKNEIAAIIIKLLTLLGDKDMQREEQNITMTS